MFAEYDLGSGSSGSIYAGSLPFICLGVLTCLFLCVKYHDHSTFSPKEVDILYSVTVGNPILVCYGIEISVRSVEAWSVVCSGVGASGVKEDECDDCEDAGDYSEEYDWGGSESGS